MNLPNDLESEILARVPAKSLSELKTTCKRWYALFRDPKFVEKNKTMNQSARETMLLSNHEVYSIAGDLHNIEPSPLELTGKLSKDVKLCTIFHCDGLILCQAKDYSSVVMWNPCTGERKMIEPRTRYRYGDRFALGYSSSSSMHSYKILRCGYYRNYYRKEEGELVVETEMYELSSDSWKVLDSSSTLDHVMYCEGVSLRGDAYFVAGGKEIGGSCFLMKFDFTDERFVLLPLPFQSFCFTEDIAVLSVVRDEKLSVCHQDIIDCSNVMRIWVTKEEGEELTWRTDSVLTVDFDKFQLPCVVNVASFLLDEEKKVAVCCETCDEECTGEEKDGIYIVGEDMYKQVYNDDIVNASFFSRPLVLTYVPSLVCIH